MNAWNFIYPCRCGLCWYVVVVFMHHIHLYRKVFWVLWNTVQVSLTFYSWHFSHFSSVIDPIKVILAMACAYKNIKENEQHWIHTFDRSFISNSVNHAITHKTRNFVLFLFEKGKYLEFNTWKNEQKWRAKISQWNSSEIFHKNRERKISFNSHEFDWYHTNCREFVWKNSKLIKISESSCAQNITHKPSNF